MSKIEQTGGGGGGYGNDAPQGTQAVKQAALAQA